MRLCHNLAKCIMFVMFLSKSINKQRYPKTAIVALKKTNRFQSGFRDACRFFQTDQTVNRKKSGFRASPFRFIGRKLCKIRYQYSNVYNRFHASILK